jgi:hypothetical protein
VFILKIQFQGKNTHELTESSYRFTLTGQTQYLRIDACVLGESTLKWYLYNPSGCLQGQAICQGNNQKVWNYSPDDAIPYGAFQNQLDSGEWIIQLLYYCSNGEAVLPWTLTVSAGMKDDIEYLQTEDTLGFIWMDSHGVVSRDYLLSNSGQSLLAWYKGDLHVHSTSSDGKMSPSQLLHEAKNRHIDFFAITEHNFFHTGWADDSMPVIPGMELTLEQGHFNLFIPSILPQYRIEFWQEIHSGNDILNTILKKFREHGAIVSVNHPLMEPWQVNDPNLDLSLIDAMEIICDPTWHTSPQSSEQALKAFNILWDHGIKITGVGGSDLHNKPNVPYSGNNIAPHLALPATYLLSDGLSVQSLMDAIMEHHVYVTLGFQVTVTAEYSGKIYQIGSGLPVMEEDEIIFRVSLCHTDQPYRVEIVENEGLIETIPLDSKLSAEFRRRWNSDYHWLRIDIRDKSGNLCGFTNPFYTQSLITSKMSWGNLVELVEKTSK